MATGMEIMLKALISNLPPEVIGQIGQIGQVVASFQGALTRIEAQQAEIIALLKSKTGAKSDE